MADPMPPPEAFVYREIAIGGANNRNNVVRADDFRSGTDAVDAFATFLLYP